jgi:hypothetical protein
MQPISRSNVNSGEFSYDCINTLLGYYLTRETLAGLARRLIC